MCLRPGSGALARQNSESRTKVAKQKNEFDPHLRRLLDAITRVEYQSYVTDTRTRRQREHGERPIAAWTAAGSPPRPFGAIFGAGAALPISDPFANELAYFSYASMGAGGVAYLNVLDEINRRIQAESLTIVYEELERFFKECGSLLYWRHRKPSDDSWPIDAGFKLGSLFRRQIKGTPQYYTEYVKRLTRRNCKELLKVFEAHLTGFRDRARANPRGQDLLDAFKALEFCRHTTVHSAGRINPDELKRLPPSARAIVEQTRNTSAITGESKVLPPKPITGELLSWMADLGYVLYRVASDDCNMTVGFTPGGGWA
jgi:hypothetical protein